MSVYLSYCITYEQVLCPVFFNVFSHVEVVVGISNGILVHFLCPYNGIHAVWESYASRSSRIWT